MFPGFSNSSVAYGRSGDTIPLRQFLNRCWRIHSSFFANLDNNLIREFGKMLLISSRLIASVFLFSVFSVIRICTEKKMIWTNTRTVVASVTNKYPIGDFTVRQFPRNSMRHEGSQPIFSSTESNHSVAMFSSPSRPFPTLGFHNNRSILTDSFPKPINIWKPEGSNSSTHSVQSRHLNGGLQL